METTTNTKPAEKLTDLCRSCGRTRARGKVRSETESGTCSVCGLPAAYSIMMAVR